MTPELILELVGYFASFLVLVSLLMTSVVKLRIINSIGAAIFTVYAILIRSYPTAVMNFALVFVNLYFLVKVLRTKTLLSTVETLPDDNCVEHFLHFYREDIARCFPDYDFATEDGQLCCLVYADANPVGLLIGKCTTPDTLEVSLDYACPSHRDCSVGRYLYDHLKEAGIRCLVADGHSKRHSAYLQKMGFCKENGRYTKTL